MWDCSYYVKWESGIDPTIRYAMARVAAQKSPAAMSEAVNMGYLAGVAVLLSAIVGHAADVAGHSREAPAPVDIARLIIDGAEQMRLTIWQGECAIAKACGEGHGRKIGAGQFDNGDITGRDENLKHIFRPGEMAGPVAGGKIQRGEGGGGYLGDGGTEIVEGNFDQQRAIPKNRGDAVNAQVPAASGESIKARHFSGGGGRSSVVGGGAGVECGNNSRAEGGSANDQGPDSEPVGQFSGLGGTQFRVLDIIAVVVAALLGMYAVLRWIAACVDLDLNSPAWTNYGHRVALLFSAIWLGSFAIVFCLWFSVRWLLNWAGG